MYERCPESGLAGCAYRGARWRGFALMPVAVVAVHQLRYWLAYRSHAGAELGRQGHSYLGSITPWAVMLAACSAGVFLSRLARGRFSRGAAERSASCRLGVWAASTSALLAIYALQEWLEGAFANGHPDGIAGIFGHGGWWAVPAAVVVGGLLALALRAADAIVALAARRTRLPLRPRRGQALRARTTGFVRCSSPLADCRAGRAPPALIGYG